MEEVEGAEEFVLVTNSKALLPTSGTVFIEARIKDDLEVPLDGSKIREDLEEQLSKTSQAFDLWADLLADDYTATLMLGSFYERSKEILQSLKVVEYIGPHKEVQCYSSDNVQVKVHVYKLYRTLRSHEENEGLPQADITYLPHIKFDGRWDEFRLVFEQDFKADLIWMMTNILRFSQKSGREPGEMNPLILLHGSPGTGKTTLCQGLAQKVSIRLNSTYKRTTLVQIKTAALLSRYYSESAKQVDVIFTTLHRMCKEDPEQFVCVLIDEVETIANSRDSSMQCEGQESLRATNALLTGLDRTRNFPNIMFLCTSNMIHSLDAAFLDRCGLKLAVEPPSVPSQYIILRDRLQKLITRGIVLTDTILPSYPDARLEFCADRDLPGGRLLRTVELINSRDYALSEGGISARSLTQLPEQALLRYLREEECDLGMALGFIDRYVLAEHRQAKKEMETKSEDDDSQDIFGGVQARGRKRKFTELEEHSDLDRALLAMEDLITTLRGRYQRRASLV